MAETVGLGKDVFARYALIKKICPLVGAFLLTD